MEDREIVRVDNRATVLISSLTPRFSALHTHVVFQRSAVPLLCITHGFYSQSGFARALLVDAQDRAVDYRYARGTPLKASATIATSAIILRPTARDNPGARFNNGIRLFCRATQRTDFNYATVYVVNR